MTNFLSFPVGTVTNHVVYYYYTRSRHVNLHTHASPQPRTKTNQYQYDAGYQTLSLSPVYFIDIGYVAAT